MSGRSELRLLLADDDSAVVRLLDVILRTHGFKSPVHVGTGREALAAAGDADIVLLDHQLPDIKGADLIDAIRARPDPPAVILITGHGDESLAAAAGRRGAEDYLVKDASLAEMLPRVVERVRRSRALAEALETAERDLVRAERLAAIGELTVTLHHSINNPLMCASTEVELLLGDSAPLTSVQRTSLEAVRAALCRIRDTVKQIGDLREARSTEYLGGIRMIDPSSSVDAQPTPYRGVALLHIPDEDLARVTSLLLRHAGFQVQRAPTVPELQRASGGFDVSLVLVAGRDGASGADPLDGFVPQPRRGYRVVALVAGDGAAAAAAGADHVVPLPFDPATMSAELAEMVSPKK